ncbi:MAG: methylmalonyl-CoA mutase family protein, partial [Chloroflexi bacterium]|nr:methylmalonyl-CoA mutase family protein [Chloroflexota bacterium]
NTVRVAIQALAAVLGGTQSLHTNSLDEALALPSEFAARIALRTQQIIAHESGVTNTVDPLGGSYFVEALTNRMEQEAYHMFHEVDSLGGVIPAIEHGYFQREIADSAARYQREIEEHKRVMVGVNEYTEEAPLQVPILKLDPQGERRQLDRLNRVRRERDGAKHEASLCALREAAKGSQNLMPFIVEAVKSYATLQEMMDVFRQVFGIYQEPIIL